MSAEQDWKKARLFRNGRNQAVRIPREFELQVDEVYIHREGSKLVIEPEGSSSDGLLAMLNCLEPIDEELPREILEAAGSYAKERGIGQSRLIAEALEEYLVQHGGEAVTEQLDRIYGIESSELAEPLVRAQAAVLDDEAW